MKKEYGQPEGNSKTDKVNEPEAAYRAETEMTFSPPLTEEELADAMTGEEFLDAVCNHIHELFSAGGKKQSASVPCGYTMEELKAGIPGFIEEFENDCLIPHEEIKRKK